MHDRRSLTAALLPALIGGLLSGLIGALLFATAHAAIIAPIWGRMWGGVLWGALAGMAAGWALIEIVPATLSAPLRRSVALGAAFGTLLWCLVAPVTLFDALLRRLGVPEQNELIEVTVAITVAIVSGAAFAWWRTRRWRAAIAGALATVLLTVAMAGPVPIGRSTRAVQIFVAVLPVAAIAGAAFGVLVRHVAGRLGALAWVEQDHHPGIGSQ